MSEQLDWQIDGPDKNLMRGGGYIATASRGGTGPGYFGHGTSAEQCLRSLCLVLCNALPSQQEQPGFALSATSRQTKRNQLIEQFASAALAGMVKTNDDDLNWFATYVAHAASQYADAMLKAMEAPNA